MSSHRLFETFTVRGKLWKKINHPLCQLDNSREGSAATKQAGNGSFSASQLDLSTKSSNKQLVQGKQQLIEVGLVFATNYAGITGRNKFIW